MLKKAIIYLPLGKPIDIGSGFGCMHLSDPTRLHIDKVIRYIEAQENIEEIFPKKTIVFSSDLPTGIEALDHFKSSLGTDIATRTIEGLAFDFVRSSHDKPLCKREVQKVWTELKKAIEVEGCEWVIMIGDNTFPVAIEVLQATGISFMEFSKKGSLVPVMTGNVPTDNFSKSKRKDSSGFVTTIVPHRVYYTLDNSTVLISDDDEIAVGNLYTGHVVGKEDEKLYWLKNGLNLYDEKLNIVHMKTT